MDSRYLTAKEVTTELGISFGTLYSYVSRGLIRSEETSGATRQKRYWAEDVRMLRNRRDRKRNPAVSAATALDFGDPVMESSISLIDQGELYYRGHAAVDLARTTTFEHVACLLWADQADTTLWQEWAASVRPATDIQPLLAHLPPELTAVERFHALIPVAEAQDLAAHDKTSTGVCRTAARLFTLLLTAITGTHAAPDTTIAQRLLAHWRPDAPELTPLLDAALILCADHELNASSFTARCVASTGATPYGAVTAALAALQGPIHGGDTARCELLVREAAPNPRQTLAAWLRRGENVSGFGHRLYPGGDPRGRVLLELVEQYVPDSPVLRTIHQLSVDMQETFGRLPNLDLALVAVAQAAGLPQGTPLVLFSAGRLAGWIAHIIEQYQAAALIRPRAHYIGRSPHGESAPAPESPTTPTH